MEKQPNKATFMKQEGRAALIERYNINDQAHAKSSPDDFVETTSQFHHADAHRQDDIDPLFNTSDQKPSL